MACASSVVCLLVCIVTDNWLKLTLGDLNWLCPDEPPVPDPPWIPQAYDCTGSAPLIAGEPPVNVNVVLTAASADPDHTSIATTTTTDPTPKRICRPITDPPVWLSIQR